MQGFSAKVIHQKPLKKDVHGALRFPVYDGSAFEFDSAEDIEKAFKGMNPSHMYSRITNPTVEYFEQQIRSATGAQGALALSSGMAAISNTVLGICSAGENVVTSRYLFGNTYSLFKNTLEPWGLKVKFADFSRPESVEECIDEKTKMIFLETITNPQLQVADIEAIGKIAKKKGVVLVADTTITPLAFADLKGLGVNIEVVSNTKYISGGATSVGGLIVDYGTYNWANHERYKEDAKKFGPFAFLRKMRKVIYRDLGACLSPHNAYLQSLGLESFKLRVKESCRNSLKIAEFLQEHPGVVSVNYPGLNPGEIVKKQFGELAGGLLTFNLASKEACFAFINRLKLIRRATNLNDNKTLIIHPASTIFCEYTEAERAEMGVGESLIRLAVGIEECEDLIGDIHQALEDIC